MAPHRLTPPVHPCSHSRLQSKHALALREKGVEILKGRSFVRASGVKCGGMMARGLLTGDMDMNDLASESVATALDGAYGARVNIEGFTASEQCENYADMRMVLL